MRLMATIFAVMGSERKGSQRMGEVITVVAAVILFLFFCVLAVTLMVWVILIIVKGIIELWRKIKEREP